MKKKEILKFGKNKVLDLTNSIEVGCNVIECGRDRFTLQEFKLQDGHDDSLPYSALLCLNDKPICRCINDGWGGETEMQALDAQTKVIMASAMTNLRKFKWSYMETIFELKLDFIADTLACGLCHKKC